MGIKLSAGIALLSGALLSGVTPLAIDGGIFTWISNGLFGLMDWLGLLGVFLLMVLESAGFPIPSELIMVGAGKLAYDGSLSLLGIDLTPPWAAFVIAILTGVIGNVVGSWVSYLIGRHAGRPAIERWGRWVFLNPKHLAWAEDWFSRRGEMTVFWSQFMPVARTYISIPAGMGRMDQGRFLFFTGLGSLPFVFLFTWTGFAFGQNYRAIEPWFQLLDILAYIVVGGWGAFMLVRIGRQKQWPQRFRHGARIASLKARKASQQATKDASQVTRKMAHNVTHPKEMVKATAVASREVITGAKKVAATVTDPDKLDAVAKKAGAKMTEAGKAAGIKVTEAGKTVADRLPKPKVKHTPGEAAEDRGQG